MTHGEHESREEGRPSSDGLDDLLRELDRSAPDQTESIMRRLGYHRVDAAAARRRRRRRLAGRVAMTLAGAVVLVAAFEMYSESTAVRRPSGPTVPAALRQDLDRQHQRIDRAFESIRRLAPRPGHPDAVPPRAPQIDESATGPGRWI